MPSSRPDNICPGKGRHDREPRNIAQLGLDFTPEPGYSNMLRKDTKVMNHELFETLDRKIGDLLEKYNSLKAENARLSEENERILAEREGFRTRIDAILGKLDGI